jgi:hypothetical protein
MDHTQEITQLATQLATDNLASWSDEKRKAFTTTFDARIRVARYILIITALKVEARAKAKSFISDKIFHAKPGYFGTAHLLDGNEGRTYNYTNNSKVGGRPTSELDAIATERAEEIIEQLPALNEAVRILSPAVALQIDRRNKLLKQGKDKLVEADKLSGPLDIDDFDQTMTIGAFRTIVKDREKQRAALLTQLDTIGNEGRTLDSKINKFLYDGLPGLSEAVVNVIKEYMDRAAGFDGLNRRVAEQVQFGDSDAAMEMLKSFERDEVKISLSIKVQFDQALDTLRLAAKTGLVKARNKKLAAPRKG